MKHLSFALAVGLTGGGLWLSHGLGAVQVWLFGAGLAGLVGIAAESYLDGPGAEEHGWSYCGFTAWVAALLLVTDGMWLVQMLPQDSLPQVAGIMAVLAGVLLLGLREALRPNSRNFHAGRFLSNLIVYLLVFVVFALIYQTRLRPLITATSAGAVALLTGLEMLRAGPSGRRIDARLIALAAIGGLIVAEIAWVLYFWPVGGLVGGAFLMLSFYVVVGLMQSIRDGSLGRSALLEYGAVGVLGFVAILFAVP